MCFYVKIFIYLKVRVLIISLMKYTNRMLHHLDIYNSITTPAAGLGLMLLYFTNLSLVNELHGLWDPEVKSRIHEGSPIIPILSRINPIFSYSYLFL